VQDSSRGTAARTLAMRRRVAGSSMAALVPRWAGGAAAALAPPDHGEAARQLLHWARRSWAAASAAPQCTQVRPVGEDAAAAAAAPVTCMLLTDHVASHQQRKQQAKAA